MAHQIFPLSVVIGLFIIGNGVGKREREEMEIILGNGSEEKERENLESILGNGRVTKCECVLRLLLHSICHMKQGECTPLGFRDSTMSKKSLSRIQCS